jgi:hypothetical protein
MIDFLAEYAIVAGRRRIKINKWLELQVLGTGSNGKAHNGKVLTQATRRVRTTTSLSPEYGKFQEDAKLLHDNRCGV